jgi:putative nucleotidyltransferase with HDIG domain
MKLFAPEQTNAGSSHERWAVDSVPPFPAIALRALNATEGTGTSLLELCDLIRTDPAFSSAVVRLANSPLIGFPKQISSVLQAAMLLGFRRLKSVVITVGLKAYLEDVYTPLLQSCWRHSLACGMVAERAATALHLDQDFAHTAGILHDIGRVAMAASMPHSYALVLEKGALEPDDLLQTEREICGIGHCEAGLTLVNAWDLPAVFLEITSHHHDAHPGSKGVVSLVGPSCMVADALGFPVVKYRVARRYEEILTEFPEPARHELPANAKELATLVKNQIRAIEAA